MERMTEQNATWLVGCLETNMTRPHTKKVKGTLYRHEKFMKGVFRLSHFPHSLMVSCFLDYRRPAGFTIQL